MRISDWNSDVCSSDLLVANLVILHNVEQMTRVLAELRQDGANISPEVLAGLSPYRTSNINRFGDYTLDPKREGAPIAFSRRLLERMASSAKHPMEESRGVHCATGRASGRDTVCRDG